MAFVNSNSNCVLLVSCCIFLAVCSILTSNVVYIKQSTPYIDEIFHIPQAQAYCNHKWTQWDKKITTFPGLYLVSYVLWKPAGFLLGISCSVYVLRFINIFGTVLNFIISYNIYRKINPTIQNHLQLLSAFNIAILPPLYFFTFLYYTDIWSTTFVLCAYNLHISSSSSKLASFTICSAAVLMRQTNVIWVGLLVIDIAWSENQLKILSRYIPWSGKKPPKGDNVHQLIRRVLGRTYHLMLVCAAFVVFVIVNGSIVVGDKHAHVPVLHFMQNLYFLLFIFFFAFPFLIVEAFHLRHSLPNALKMVLMCAFCSVLSEINRLEHPYLLADNRHLSFYIWRRVLGHPHIRHLVVPGYVLSAVLVYRLLNNCKPVFVLGLALCTFVNLTPQYLFELRYFILPYIMCRLHFRRVSTTTLCLETLLHVSVNAAVLWLFASRTFAWDSEPGALQRIIW